LSERGEKKLKINFKNLFNKVVASTLALGLVVGSFAATADAARPGFDPKKAGGTVTFASFADAVRLLPYTTSDSASSRIQGLIFEGLVTTDIKGTPIPHIATKWDISKDKLTYTFYMRKDVKFHDGKKLTANDVKHSFGLYMDEKSINPYKYLFNKIDKITVKNDYTIEFKLKEPYVFFLFSAGAAILPSHYVKTVDDFNKNTKIHRNPIGSGPFKFKEWRTAERIVVDANKTYWDGRPYLDRLIMKVVPDSNVEVINLLKGNVDFVESIQPKQVATVKRNKNLTVVKYDAASFAMIGYNLETPFFNDAKVRRALAIGLNRKSIVDKVLLKNAKLASGPFHPLTSIYNKNIQPLAYNMAEAKKLLAEAGWKIGSSGLLEKNGKVFEIEISYNQGNKVREQIATVVAQQWKQLGIKANPRSYEWSVYLDRLDTGKLDAYILGWNLGTSGDQYGLWHSKEFSPAGLNSPHVNNPKLDKLLEEFRAEIDPGKRAKIYHQVHKIMSDEQYQLWMYYPQSFAGYNKKLQGVKFSLWNRFYSVEDWYIKK
jgi:peptide/nickel transport system substrate-binding protein